LGSTYDKEFLPFFDKFLGAVYGAKFINILNFESQLIIHIDKKTCESRALSSLSNQGTPSPENSINASTSTSKAKERWHGPSDYELRQQANIAENERLLASLGLSKGGSSLIDPDKSSKNVKGKKGGKEKRYAFGLFLSNYDFKNFQIANDSYD
jgi:hypothetical protein